MDFPASLIALVQEQVARTGRLGATGLVRVPDPAAAIPVLAAGIPGEGPAPPLQFAEDGYAFALYGQERTGSDAKFATTEVKVMINGRKPLITTTEGAPAFFPFLGLYGKSVHWFPLTRRVKKRDIWQLTYRNFDAGAVANPVVGIAFLSDAEVAVMADEMSKLHG